MGTIRFLWLCYKAFKSKSDVLYFAYKDGAGMPQLTVLFGKNKCAWEVTELAVEMRPKLRRLVHGTDTP